MPIDEKVVTIIRGGSPNKVVAHTLNVITDCRWNFTSLHDIIRDAHNTTLR